MRSIRRGTPLHSLVGAVLGGLLGYLAFGWTVSQGFYAMVLPGASVGIGCGLLSTTRSLLRGILCGVAGIALGLYSEWRWFPAQRDQSFGDFLGHTYELQPLTLMLIGLGGLLSFWFGKGYFGSGERIQSEPGQHDEIRGPTNGDTQ